MRASADNHDNLEHYTVVQLPQPVQRGRKVYRWGLVNNVTGRVPRHTYAVSRLGAEKCQRRLLARDARNQQFWSQQAIIPTGLDPSTECAGSA